MVLRTPLLIYRHQRRMTELCINLPSGGFSEPACGSSFLSLYFGSGYRPRSWLLRRRLVPSCGDRSISFFLMFSSSHYNNDIPEQVTPTKKHRHIFMQRCRIMYLIFIRGKVFPVIFDALQQSVCDQLNHFINSAVCLIVAFFARPGVSFI